MEWCLFLLLTFLFMWKMYQIVSLWLEREVPVLFSRMLSGPITKGLVNKKGRLAALLTLGSIEQAANYEGQEVLKDRGKGSPLWELSCNQQIRAIFKCGMKQISQQDQDPPLHTKSPFSPVMHFIVHRPERFRTLELV